MFPVSFRRLHGSGKHLVNHVTDDWENQSHDQQGANGCLCRQQHEECRDRQNDSRDESWHMMSVIPAPRTRPPQNQNRS
jgi:hypothetical protein